MPSEPALVGARLFMVWFEQVENAAATRKPPSSRFRLIPQMPRIWVSRVPAGVRARTAGLAGQAFVGIFD